jgi:hypothetical protein
MRWPNPDELRQWTAEDQIALRKWRRAVFTFYGVVIGLLIFAATSTILHNESGQPDSVTAFTGRTNAALPCDAQKSLSCFNSAHVDVAAAAALGADHSAFEIRDFSFGRMVRHID